MRVRLTFVKHVPLGSSNLVPAPCLAMFVRRVPRRLSNPPKSARHVLQAPGPGCHVQQVHVCTKVAIFRNVYSLLCNSKAQNLRDYSE